MSKLDDWILAQQAKGYTDAQIEAHLLENGFNKETVDKALLAIQMGNPTHILPENRNKGTFLWLGISFIILLVLVGGAYYYMQTQDSSALKSYIDKGLSSIKGQTPEVPVNKSDASVPKDSGNSIDLTVNACGNEILEQTEQCDGRILGLANESKCTDFMWNSTSRYTGGNLTCTNCRHDFSACTH